MALQNVILTQDIGATATSFTVDPASPLFTQQLVFGRQYSFELNVRDLRDGATGTGNPATLSQSRLTHRFHTAAEWRSCKGLLALYDTTNAAVPVFRFAGCVGYGAPANLYRPACCDRLRLSNRLRRS